MSDIQIITLGPLYIYTIGWSQTPDGFATMLASRQEIELIQPGRDYVVLTFKGAQNDQAYSRRLIWKALHEGGKTESAEMPEPIVGDPLLMLLGQDAELRQASDGIVYFGGNPIGYVPGKTTFA